ncbi:hypothetical protein ON010_g1297 [Phytophthora cinnamomi]|nr:hypothetical protein ON010_g1297 [Phytophthora cinnamomi]
MADAAADAAAAAPSVETADVPPNHTLYLNNLNDKIKPDRLKATLYASLSQHGKILEIVMGRARRLRGQAWVTFDDVRVFQDNDCAADYTSAPAELPYDRDACLGTSTLTFYWLALHSSTWQVYVNCAPLESTTSTGATSKYAVGTSSGTSASTTSNSTSSTTSTTSAPSATTAATTSSAASSAATSTSTSTTTTTTAPTTDTSTSTTSATAAPSTNSASTTASTTTAPSTSSPSTGTTGSSGTSNQWASTNSTGSTKTNGGWSATSTAGSTSTTQGQWSNNGNGNSDVQATSGTVSPNQGTASGWNNAGWGKSFGFRH